MATLEKALLLATTAHRGQVDKAGQPYILHPLRIMMRLQTVEQQIVALLHDSVEDTNLTLEQLRQEGFSVAVLTAIDHLTHRQHDDYATYIQRLQNNPLAVKIKCLDLEDNMDVRRLDTPLSDRDLQRLKKYHNYWSLLQKMAAP